jgi:hypothetical protein
MSYFIIITIAVLLFPLLVRGVSAFLSEEKIEKWVKGLESKLGDKFPKS